MGSVVSSPKVDERFLTPQRLPKDCKVNLKTVKKMILKGELAQFYTPVECETGQMSSLEECPICFHNYPGINYFQCCNNAICTECYIHVLSSAQTLDAVCPFCKKQCPNVKFRLRSAKERQEQLVQEQAVIAAQLQARKNEDERSAREVSQRMQNGSVASASARPSHSSEVAAQRPVSSTAAAIARAQLDLEQSRATVPTPPRAAAARQERERTSAQHHSRPPDLSTLVPQNLWSMGMSEEEMEAYMLNEAMAASMREAAPPAAAPEASAAAPRPAPPHPTLPTPLQQTSRIEALQALLQNLTTGSSAVTVSQPRAQTPPPSTYAARATGPSTYSRFAPSMWAGGRVDVTPPRTAPPRAREPFSSTPAPILDRAEVDARLDELEGEMLRHAIALSLLESEDAGRPQGRSIA